MKRLSAAVLTIAVCLSAGWARAEEKKEAEGAPVTGNPPADSVFARIKPGMKFDEANKLLGEPTSKRAFCTGKHWIPFYLGRDRAYTEHYFKGQGIVVFYTDISSFGIGRYKSCTPQEPTEVAEVHYNANESGIAPKDDAKPEAKPEQAAK